MNKIEVLWWKLVSIIVFLAGLGLIGVCTVPDAYDQTLDALRDLSNWEQTLLLGGAGGLLMLLAILTLLPMRYRTGAVKLIAYPGAHGDVVIELDSVEANLNRVIGKMPEVKWIDVQVAPDEDRGKARVAADVRLIKPPRESARDTANRVTDRLAEVAANLLGVDEVTCVDLRVKGISLAPEQTVRMEAVKPAEEIPAAQEAAALAEEAQVTDETLKPAEETAEPQGAEGEPEGEAEAEEAPEEAPPAQEQEDSAPAADAPDEQEVEAEDPPAEDAPDAESQEQADAGDQEERAALAVNLADSMPALGGDAGGEEETPPVEDDRVKPEEDQ